MMNLNLQNQDANLTDFEVFYACKNDRHCADFFWIVFKIERRRHLKYFEHDNRNFCFVSSSESKQKLSYSRLSRIYAKSGSDIINLEE